MEKQSILIVEDERIVGEDMREALLYFGYDVPAIAITGEAAIKEAGEHRPDLILMDIFLAGPMNGIEAAEKIGLMYDIPIIFLTAFADAQIVERAKATEPYGYILKPYDEKELRTSIEIAIYKHALNKKLKESEARYRGFFTTSHDCVFIVSPAGSWIDFNDAAPEMFGYASREELMNVPLQGLYEHPEERAVLVKRVVEGGHVKDYPVRFRKKDGTVIDTLMTTVPLRENDGSVKAFMGSIRDITERKQAEDALMISWKKLNLLNSITRHDINNQLTALDVFIALSKDITDDPAMRDLLDKEAIISANIARQITFTKDYQEMGMRAPGWQNVPATIRRSAAAFPMQNISIDISCTDLEVFGDPLFEKVFYNLIDNALRYGGEKMTTIRVSSHDTADGTVIVFEDDGDGISCMDKRNLFERGFGKNTGLGLFLAREILSITGLLVTETGEPGKGARFEISVPKGAARFVK